MSLSGTITSWVVIFILPINSALNPILYTLTTSFFREQVELLWCHWQRQPRLKQDRKSLTSSVIYTDPSRSSFCHHNYTPQTSILDIDGRYRWKCSILWTLHLSVVDLQSFQSAGALKDDVLVKPLCWWIGIIMDCTQMLQWRPTLDYVSKDKLLWLDNNENALRLNIKCKIFWHCAAVHQKRLLKRLNLLQTF